MTARQLPFDRIYLTFNLFLVLSEEEALRVEFQGISTKFGYFTGLDDFLSFSVVV